LEHSCHMSWRTSNDLGWGYDFFFLIFGCRSKRVANRGTARHQIYRGSKCFGSRMTETHRHYIIHIFAAILLINLNFFKNNGLYIPHITTTLPLNKLQKCAMSAMVEKWFWGRSTKEALMQFVMYVPIICSKNSWGHTDGLRKTWS
jgi:hypothetical protein